MLCLPLRYPEINSIKLLLHNLDPHRCTLMGGARTKVNVHSHSLGALAGGSGAIGSVIGADGQTFSRSSDPKIRLCVYIRFCLFLQEYTCRATEETSPAARFTLRQVTANSDLIIRSVSWPDQQYMSAWGD
jgi:hypothetical protein